MIKQMAGCLFLIVQISHSLAASTPQASDTDPSSNSVESKSGNPPKPPPADPEMLALEACVGPEQTKAVKHASEQRLMQQITQAGIEASVRATPAERATEIRRATLVAAANAMMREREAVLAELRRLCQAKPAQ